MIDWQDFEAWMEEARYRDSTIRTGVPSAQRLVALLERGEPPDARLRWAAYRLESYAEARELVLDERLRKSIEQLREDAVRRRHGNARGGQRRNKRKRTATSVPDAEWLRLWAAVLADDTLEARVLEVIMATGLRVGDALRVTRSALSRAMQNGVIHIEVKGGDELVRNIDGAPDAWSHLLQAWQGQPGATVAHLLVPDGDGSAHAGDAPYKRVSRRLKVLAKEAGLTARVHPHRLRRTVAVQALRVTDNVHAVGQLLGHAPGSAATNAYIDEARPERVAALQRQLGERFREEGT